jgi:hypothetical protein
MPSLKDNFEELMARIAYGRELTHASFEPIYYLIFPPSQILEVKRTLPAWQARLRNDGWNVHTFSIAQEVTDILRSAPMRRIWVMADRKAPQDYDKTNQSLANALNRGALQDRLEVRLAELDGDKRAILLVTDLEALHPYMRIGAIETQLAGKFHLPTIFLYPGERTGKTRLRFLGFYQEDGNYRSVHVGG